eukprot:CAMPEP_0182800154 /NCGR_PEP_ID=MMETSP0006_2-20121128/2259_1 /TAXON_ID=97485 /ORGANISM="Prymnesium parvum, Strain Texoma1" /LENGTH=143 /DNA_ID=CAMNT_0024925373 /DNA_START=615 /DNA_END=1042 /DNA_ORIENTATION=-
MANLNTSKSLGRTLAEAWDVPHLALDKVECSRVLRGRDKVVGVAFHTVVVLVCVAMRILRHFGVRVDFGELDAPHDEAVREKRLGDQVSEIVAGSRVEIVAENQVGAQWTSGGEVGVFVGIRSQVELQSKRAGPRMDQGDLTL